MDDPADGASISNEATLIPEPTDPPVNEEKNNTEPTQETDVPI